MALNLSPEKGVKLTKKDRAHVLKKMKQGWKATCLVPDYVFDENGDIQIGLEKTDALSKSSKSWMMESISKKLFKQKH